MKNPKMKNILTDRLTTLLEELDEEEDKKEIKSIEMQDTNLLKTDTFSINKVQMAKDVIEEPKRTESNFEALKINQNFVNDGKKPGKRVFLFL